MDLDLYCHADAAFADYLLTRYSTARHVIFLGEGLVYWKSKKQGIMTISSSEAKFINLTPAIKSLKWIAKLLVELGYPQKVPLLLYTDSQNAKATILNPLNSARTRNIDIWYKYILDAMEKGKVKL